MKNDKFKSNIGFILTSAGCAIGLGNIWRFPYIAGLYGGGTFIAFYLLAIALFAVPLVKMELSIGRQSGLSASRAFEHLASNKGLWKKLKWIVIAVNYVYMMFYCTVASQVLWYVFCSMKGFEELTAETSAALYQSAVSSPVLQVLLTIGVIGLGFIIIKQGVASGLERASSFMVASLLILLIAVAAYCAFLPGASEGLKVYLIPDLELVREIGVLQLFREAATQAFFSIGIGSGSLIVFGSYMDTGHSTPNKSAKIIIALDSIVAFLAGMLIFSACSSCGVEIGMGPKLIFVVLPVVFSQIPLGSILAVIFFVVLFMAAFTTIISAFECNVKVVTDLFGASRNRAIWINCVLMSTLAMPAALGCNLFSFIQPFGAGTSILDLEDFILSKILQPGGCMLIVLFCTTRFSWGWSNYQKAAYGLRRESTSSWNYYYNKYGLLLIIVMIWTSFFAF